METSLSLLRRLKEGNTLAWEEFNRRYGELIRGWCHRWGVRSSDSDDLLQETCLRILGGLATFRRQGRGSFRAWIRVIARNCWAEVVQRAQRQQNLEVLRNFQESLQPLKSLENGLLQLMHEELLQLALASVRRRVSPKNWEAFRMTMLEERRPEEVAELLQISTAQVYVAKSRVQRLVSDELKRLSESW